MTFHTPRIPVLLSFAPKDGLPTNSFAKYQHNDKCNACVLLRMSKLHSILSVGLPIALYLTPSQHAVVSLELIEFTQLPFQVVEIAVPANSPRTTRGHPLGLFPLLDAIVAAGCRGQPWAPKGQCLLVYLHWLLTLRAQQCCCLLPPRNSAAQTAIGPSEEDCHNAKYCAHRGLGARLVKNTAQLCVHGNLLNAVA